MALQDKTPDEMRELLRAEVGDDADRAVFLYEMGGKWFAKALGANAVELQLRIDDACRRLASQFKLKLE
jgi:hypothetical protein